MTKQQIPQPRAWHIPSDKYFKVSLIDYEIKRIHFVSIKPVYNVSSVPFSEVILEWPTGLPDKNGKMIYQGDIMEIYSDSVNVIWKDCSFRLVFNGGWPFGKELKECNTHTKIIGNVNQNPELMEVAK